MVPLFPLLCLFALCYYFSWIFVVVMLRVLRKELVPMDVLSRREIYALPIALFALFTLVYFGLFDIGCGDVTSFTKVACSSNEF